MAYGQEPILELTYCRIQVGFTGNWGQYKLEINATGENNCFCRCMTGPEFRKFFGGKDAKDTAELIAKYNGTWTQKSHMNITFERMEEAKAFVDDIIAPKMLMAKMGSAVNG